MRENNRDKLKSHAETLKSLIDTQFLRSPFENTPSVHAINLVNVFQNYPNDAPQLETKLPR
jgi:hypothetical protein